MPVADGADSQSVVVGLFKGLIQDSQLLDYRRLTCIFQAALFFWLAGGFDPIFQVMAFILNAAFNTVLEIFFHVEPHFHNEQNLCFKVLSYGSLHNAIKLRTITVRKMAPTPGRAPGAHPLRPSETWHESGSGRPQPGHPALPG